MQPEEFQKQFNVSRETLDRLISYNQLLQKWQKAINLVSPGSLQDSWERHFADSAQIEKWIPQNSRICDLGSGAGFPGLVLAILRPDVEMHLVESDGRKCEFLKNVSRETKSPVSIHNDRVEKAIESIRADVISARGFAPLEEIFAVTEAESQRNSALIHVLLKGRGAAEEVQKAQEAYEFSVKSVESATDSEAKILVITSLQKKLTA